MKLAEPARSGQERLLDLAAMLVALGIEGLMMYAGNVMYYLGNPDAWVPFAVAPGLSFVIAAYARVRKPFR